MTSRSAPARHAAVALAAVGALLAGALLALGPSTAVAGPANGPAAGPTTVTDAVLRWGVNNESNNRAFAPGTHNFFSAGIVPDPGRGGTTLPQGSWRSEDGNVRIEKRQPGGTYATATWAGLGTTADGSEILSPTSGRFSDHQVVVRGGTGSVDAATGFAQVSWKGSFTVLYYSGMSFFTVTDPTLTVTPERAQLTATAGGFASDMEDQSTWVALPPTPVVLADLPRGEVDLAATDGFTSTPAYLGVGWTPPGDESAQVGGAFKGAFPASLLDFLSSAGTAGYWYSTGGATDAYKPALPLTVGWTGAPVSATASPTKSPTKTPTKTPTKSPTRSPTQDPSASATTAPSSTPTPTPSPTSTTTSAPASIAGTSGTADPSAAGEVSAGAAVRGAPIAITPVLVSSVTGSPAGAEVQASAAGSPAAPGSERLLWLLGCVLLLGALATTLTSTLIRTSTTARDSSTEGQR